MTDRVEDTVGIVRDHTGKVYAECVICGAELRDSWFNDKGADYCVGCFADYRPATQKMLAALDAKLDRMASMIEAASAGLPNTFLHGFPGSDFFDHNYTPQARAAQWADWVKHGPRKDGDGG